MKKNKPRRLTTFNKVILTILLSFLFIFALIILLVTNTLLTQSKNTARDLNREQGDYITNSVKNNMQYLSGLLNLTQQSLAELDHNSPTADTAAEKILVTMLDLAPNTYCAWFIFEKGKYYKDRHYMKEFIKEDGVITENYSPNSEEELEDPDNNPWYFTPLKTGEIFFDNGAFYDYGTGEGEIFTATLSVPIKTNGEVVGVCGVDLVYSDMFDPIYDFNKGEGRTVLLMSEDMTILHASNSIYITKNLADFSFDDIGVIKDAIKNKIEFSGIIHSPFLNKKALVSLRPILFNAGDGYPPLFIYISIALETLYSEAYNITFIIIAGGFLCMFLMAGSIFIGAKSIIKPITVLTAYAQQIAEGNFNAEYSSTRYPLPPPHPDDDIPDKSEVATLQRAFVKMLDALHDNLSSVEKRVEERTQELRKLNSYLQLLMESASDMFVLVDREMNIVYCSNSVLNLFELKDFNEITGKSISHLHELYTDQGYAARSDFRFSVIRFGEDWLIEDDVINWPTIGRRSYRIIYRRVIDENGLFGGIVLILHDVTDVRVEESERRMSDMLHSTQMPCMVWDDAGNVIAFNNEFASFFGYPENTPSEDLNKIFTEIHPVYQPEGRTTEEMRQEFFHEVLEKGFARRVARLVKRDGTPIDFAVYGARISWHSGYRMVLYYHDLTEIQAKEAEAKEAEERIRVMLDRTPMICILRDENQNVIDCNQEALNLFGFTNKSDLIENYYTLYPEFQPDGAKSVDKYQEIFDSLSENESYNSFEWTFLTAQGQPIPVETTFVRIQWKDTYRYISYSRDLREAKANEQKMLESIEQSRTLELQKEAAQAASEAKSQFLANMSHEIRTPMNAVLGMAELLLSENLNKRQLRYVEDIRTSALALLEIINDILDLSKIQSGKLSLIPVHYDFSALIENISSMAHFLVKNKDLVFKLDIHGELPKCLYGDDVRLRQVILNILSNAIKFTGEGYVSLIIDITDTSIKFAVSDTGIGIKEEDIPTLFDAFVQADVIKNRGKKGTGLGLSITKALIDMMEGQISVESVYGKGTTFRIELPKVLGDEKKIHSIGSSENTIYAPDAKALVIDDNTINLNVISGLLQLCKIKVETAESGPEAIELLRNNKYDIVFMDHMMPEMDGAEATKIIREMGITVPVIALTANAVSGAKDMLLAAGMDDFLSKPIIKTSLFQLLKNWIPGEKLITPPADTTVSDDDKIDRYESFWGKIEQINELSIPIGLDRVSGRKDVYEKSLKLLIKEIEKCVKNLGDFLASNDMRNFTIEVHSMKASLANIGAMELSVEAEELEIASNQMDVFYCSSNLPSFSEKLEFLNNKLKVAFSKLKQSGGVAVEIPPELIPILKKMLDAFTEIDFLTINEELEKLDAMALDSALKERIEQISDAVLIMNYDDAGKVIQELLGST